MRTVFRGSPRYFGASKRTVFTRPEPRNSMTGMTRGRNISGRKEVGKHAHAVAVALLGMELSSNNIAFCDCGIERDAILRRGQYLGTLSATNMVIMDKIEPGLVAKPIQQWVRAHRTDVVPPHMRKAHLAATQGESEANGFGIEPSESG